MFIDNIELLNAISLLPHNIILFYYGNILLKINVIIHLPTAFFYHSYLIFNNINKIDNNLRRLDQTTQLICSCILTFITLKSIIYTLFVSIINIYFIDKLWNSKYTNDNNRWIDIMIDIFLYMIPIFLYENGIYYFFIGIIPISLTGILTFYYKIKKIQYIFHLSLIPLSYVLIEIEKNNNYKYKI